MLLLYSCLLALGYHTVAFFLNILLPIIRPYILTWLIDHLDIIDSQRLGWFHFKHPVEVPSTVYAGKVEGILRYCGGSYANTTAYCVPNVQLGQSAASGF